MAHGIRKVNEYIVRSGRAITLTQDITKNINAAEWKGVADGTIYVDFAKRGLKIKSPAKTGETEIAWRNLLPTEVFLPKSIPGTLLTDRTVTEINMATNSIDTHAIINRRVTSSKIALKGILDEHFETNSLNGNRIKDNTLSGTKFLQNSITLSVVNSSFMNQSINGNKLVNLSVGSIQLSDASVSTKKIGPKAVTLDKMADKSVGEKQLCDASVSNRTLGTSVVENDNLAENSVDFANLKIDSVRRNAIKDLEVIESKLANSSVTTIKINDEACTESKLATNSVTTVKIKDKNVTMAKLEQSVQNAINNAVKHDNGKATVFGNLQVNGDIIANPKVPDKSLSVTGFRVYNPLFADFAEGFVPAEPLEEGDIVEVDQHTCVRKSCAASRSVVGVVSERHGICLDATSRELERGSKVAVGLVGKVPIKVMGIVNAGDTIISAGEGIGVVSDNPKYGTIVGIALEDKKTRGIGKIICLIK